MFQPVALLSLVLDSSGNAVWLIFNHAKPVGKEGRDCVFYLGVDASFVQIYFLVTLMSGSLTQLSVFILALGRGISSCGKRKFCKSGCTAGAAGGGGVIPPRPGGGGGGGPPEPGKSGGGGGGGGPPPGGGGGSGIPPIVKKGKTKL